MHETDANKKAWSLLAADHYTHYKELLAGGKVLLNEIIRRELGDIAGRSLIHLQCNTGADSVSLARLGARVTGIDFVPDNIRYARLLAADCGVSGINFLECDIMQLAETHHETYDIVFTSEGAIGWLPGLARWGRTIRGLLKPGGYCYIMDSHPFFLSLDEAQLAENNLVIKYPYFRKTPDRDDSIGGYATEPRQGENYFWMYTMADVVNALAATGLHIEYLHEYDKLFESTGGMEQVTGGLYQHPFFKGKLALTFSLKATLRA